MTVFAIIEGLTGAGLVSAVLSDVFRSVVVPRATTGRLRLGPVLGASALRVVLAWTRRQPRQRQALLGALGPVLLVTSMLVWVALMILGYGMLLHALGSGLRPVPSLGDALYAAGSVFLTTGLSGQEAVSGGVRLLTVVAALSGLAVITLVVTFLLQVQTALHRRESLVLRLGVRTGPRPSGTAILLAHARLGGEGEAALRGFFNEWEAWIAEVLLTHRAFPVLVYFRSTDEECEWLAALGAVLDAAALVAALDHHGAAEHARLCCRLGTRLTTELAAQFGLHAPHTPGLTEAAFHEALGALRQAGYATGPDNWPDNGPDNEAAWTGFQALRSRYMPPLLAVTDRFGISTSAWEAHPEAL